MTGPNSPVLSILETAHDPYFVQRVKVNSQFAAMPRQVFLAQFLAGKTVLHVGYADWPITDINANLHVVLDAVCARLDGVDPHDEAAAAIRPFVRGELFRSIEEVNGSYDVVLIPEVIEHVGNIEGFFAGIDRVDFKTALITVPDAYSCMQRHFDLVRHDGDETFFEVVHPDHNCWFTPYTFRNLVTKYTSWSVTDTVWFFNGISLMLFADKER
jgi:hypothetical protein